VFGFHTKNLQTSRVEIHGLQGMSALIQRWIPKFGQSARIGNALEHLGTMPLTAQSSLALVRLHDETLLLGITPQNITLLAKSEGDSTGAPALADGPRHHKEPIGR
jgi:flagellar biogenesis protein FliO